MDTSIFLAQLMGIYMAIMGVAIIAKQKSLMSAIDDLFKNHFLSYVVGVITLILGLLVVLNHNIWDGSWRVLVTVFGWVALLKGLLYIFLSDVAMKRMVAGFSSPATIYSSWYSFYISRIVSDL